MSPQFGGGNPWDLIQEWDLELFDEEILDSEKRRHWEMAFRLAGGLPYIWQELARPISEIVYGLLELKEGSKVLLIGEGIHSAGWDADINQLIGDTGRLETVEIIRQGRKAVHEGLRGRNGQIGCWQWDYAQQYEDNTFDAVAVLQATQHSDDWNETARDLTRVLKPGKRIVLAEAVLTGPTFMSRVNSDVHLRQWYDKLYEHIDASRIPYYSQEELFQAFQGSVTSPQTLEWRGIEMFWGRKAA